MVKLKEHIIFILDSSGSMSGLTDTLKSVYNKQINALKSRSSAEQEVRVSVYSFNHNVSNLAFDVDCLRSPNIESYKASGNTNLALGILTAINDIAKIPQLYGEYSYLIYVISDGMPNEGFELHPKLKSSVSGLPDNITLCFLAPNAEAKHNARNLGIPVQNIQLWEVSATGLEEVGEALVRSTDTYLTTRSVSGGATKKFDGLFNINAQALNTKVVSKLDELLPAQYELFNVNDKIQIKTFWEQWHSGQTYRIGSGYYQFMKVEHIQPHKNVLIQEKTTGKVFTGPEVRAILGLPNHTVKVDPANHPKYDIFVQSTAPNRNLIPGTKVIYLK